jgi:Collagen triple helix repeat (20 copies)
MGGLQLTEINYEPYYPDGWHDGPNTTTPIIAAALDVIDEGITAATDQANLALVTAESISNTPGPAGPQGLTGSAGLQGEQGPAGPTGPEGPQGPAGVTGTTGPAGPVGPAGLTWCGVWSNTETYITDDAVSYEGNSYFAIAPSTNIAPAGAPLSWAIMASQGAQGIAGPAGPAGPIGPAGAIGPAGPTGAVGPQGSAGVNGNTIWYGAGAPSNGLGNNGDFYINDVSWMIYGPKISGTWPAGVALIGPQGITGATGATGIAGPQGSTGTSGNTIWSGSGVPSNSLGNNGDFYIDIVASFIYGPKLSNAWPAGISLVGPQGIQGIQGPTGSQGIQGPAGIAGSAGSIPGLFAVVNNASAGTNGETLTISNSEGNGQNAFTAIETESGGIPFIFTNAELQGSDTLCFYVASNGSTGVGIGWILPPYPPDLWTRHYVYWSESIAGASPLILFFGGDIAGYLQFTGSKLELICAAITPVTGDNTYVANTWYRIETHFHIDESYGYAEMRTYSISGVAMDVLKTTEGSNGPVHFGNLTNTPKILFGDPQGYGQASYLSDLAVSTAGWIGP